MTKKPKTYYRITRILWNSLRLPDADHLSKKRDLTAGLFRARFAEANPGWPEAAVGVKLSRGGWLREVRLCYDKRFRPVRCRDRQYGAPDDTPMKIWRGM